MCFWFKKKKSKIKVSVIIPVYNQEELIIRCLDSIPKRKDIEIITINDGSTDNTELTLLKYQNKVYNDLNIITYNKNKGVSYARNQDSDDFIYAKEFDKIVNRYLKGKDMVYYNMEDNGKKVYVCSEQNYQNRWGMFKFIRRDFIKKTRFEVGKQYAEDKAFTLKLLNKYPSVMFTNLTMYHYNYPRSGSLSAIGENRK